MKPARPSAKYIQNNGTRSSGSIRQSDRSDCRPTQASSLSLKSASASCSSENKPSPGFFQIDVDIFLLIANYLEVWDILALRQTCKVLSQQSMSHSVWSTMVSENIIARNLPWPSYALPLSQVPAVTLEQLCIRAVQMARKWDSGRLGNDIGNSRCIQRPWNSITWMAMFRSRWLLIQLNARRLELWDLGRPFTSTPISHFDGLDDLVDGHKFLQSSTDSSMIALSVRSYKTYHIYAVLPQIGVQTRQSPQLGVLYIVAGCSGLLDANKHLALFSRSTSKAGVIAQCQHSAVTTILRSEKEEPILDYAPSAKIMTHFVIVVRRTGIELYSVDAIQTSLQFFGQKLNRTNQVFPTQVIPYPGGQHVLRATFLNTPLHWVGRPSCGTDVVYLGLDRDDEESTRAIHAVYPNTSDGAGSRFTLSPPQRMLNSPTCTGSDPTVLCMWGETGRRMVHVGDVRELCVFGLSVPIGFGVERFVVDVRERHVARWKIPYSRRDLARYLAFDEATGVCAVALGSGRIWIMDPIRGTDFKDANAPIEEIEFSNLTHPDPNWASKWRKPWPGDIGHPSTLRNSMLPRMATKVNRWFPGKNNPKAFGSVTWFVNEVLHIPGRATVLLFGTPYPEYCSFNRFDLVDINERLLCIERDDGMALYDIKLLDTNITLQDVVAHLKGGGLLGDLAGVGGTSLHVVIKKLHPHGHDSVAAHFLQY
ncbi:hypothetical protein M407DRAFT_24859 [Tulasnella calospora MUT 4182]|uniref:F-box domain-containing protein n=1 Tax=Tulasnella calospora MUT 4182 TaxID=1051891 RepID=A0A0C3QIK0_9AGAM|nr:hypothetical protein M407DRAFT_24859 [Tulasnella calospora MUT 4182]